MSYDPPLQMGIINLNNIIYLARKWWIWDLNLDLSPESLLLPTTFILPPTCYVISHVEQLQVGIQWCIASDIYKRIC